MLSYELTFGAYTNIFNVAAGTTIATTSYGPAHEAQASRRHNLKLPPLQHWNDVAFVEYRSQAQSSSTDLEELKYVIKYQVMSGDGPQVVDKIFAAPNFQIAPLWKDKLVFVTQDWQGRDLLASQNVPGIAWQLIQYKQVFGRKTVNSITLFRDDGREAKNPSLLVELGDL